jgi:hypothetical protein
MLRFLLSRTHISQRTSQANALVFSSSLKLVPCTGIYTHFPCSACLRFSFFPQPTFLISARCHSHTRSHSTVASCFLIPTPVHYAQQLSRLQQSSACSTIDSAFQISYESASVVDLPLLSHLLNLSKKSVRIKRYWMRHRCFITLIIHIIGARKYVFPRRCGSF